MGSQPGDFTSAGSVVWSSTVASTTTINLKFNNLGGSTNSKTGSDADAAKASAKLDSALCSADPHPVIVGVKHATKTNPDGTTQDIFPTHFVLVTGKNSTTGQYTIIDPNPGSGITTLSGYGDDYTTRGTVQDPPGDRSRLEIVSDSPVSLTLIDPSGNRTGFDSASGKIRQDIPQSAYFTDAILNDVDSSGLIGPTHTIDVFQPVSPGVHSIVATGGEASPYSISLIVVLQDGTLHNLTSLSGKAQPGSTDTFTLNFSSAPGATSTTAAMPGDRNGDGKVDCADLRIEKAAFGTRRGQPGFDPPADVNGDGVVDILDLAVVARALPIGTNCGP
jgi:hypothetical protein